MENFKGSFFFLVIFLYITCTKSSHDTLKMSDDCTTQMCNNNDLLGRYVQFPFLIKNNSLPSHCGFPGFDLLCNEDDKLVINLPDLGAFSVEDIDYVKQELWLNDLDDCLPRKLILLNGTSFKGKSQFVPLIEQEYWFYNCSNEFFNSSDDSIIRPIKCLSGQNYEVFASTEDIVMDNSSTCDNLGPFRVPVRKGSENGREISTELSDNIVLTWATLRDCGDNNTSLDLGCFNFPRLGVLKSTMFTITLTFVTPIVCVTICIVAYFIIKAIRDRRRRRVMSLLPSIFAHALPSVLLTLESGQVTQGLDRATIDSYPEVVLSESMNPDESNCPICLGEYMTEETLKTIPDCGHYFHAGCIDEWLMLNASCPVCRNLPTESSPN